VRRGLERNAILLQNLVLVGGFGYQNATQLGGAGVVLSVIFSRLHQSSFEGVVWF